MGRWNALLLAVVLVSCSAPAPSRVVVLGLEGLDRRTVDRLISEDKLPQFRRLRREGAYARLVAGQPAPNDRALWSTMATGRTPGPHESPAAVWSILAGAGRRVAVVGWRGPWPSQTVGGFFVRDGAWERLAANAAVDDPELVRPKELMGRLRPLLRRGEDSMLAASHTYHAVALELWQSEPLDLLMVELPIAEAVSHSNDPFPAVASEQVRLELERNYAEVDRLVGEYIAAMDGRTTLLVTSDHGFQRAAEGVLYLLGHGVKQGARIDAPTPFDIAPTILALAGLVPPRDMPGRAVVEALAFGVAGPTRVAGRQAPADGPGVARARADADFKAARFAEAVAGYRRLVQQAPADPALRTSLAGALGAAGQHEEALRQLEVAIRIAPLDPTAHHNRGATLESLGRRDDAVAEYRVALKYSPEYEPAQRALLRLTGSTDPDPPRDDKERRARALAEEAGAAARHQEYVRADALLNEAERLAPKSALVSQYRSNVAYLEGDQGAAVRALEKALSLDPGNALYAANLESLRRQQRLERH